MLFSSIEFIAGFLPIALLLYYLARRRNFTLAMAVLTLTSLFYYAWWNPPYLLVIVLSMAANFGASHAIYKWPKGKRPLFLLGLLANLGALFFFKYTNFFFDQINLFQTHDWHIDKIILPLGISFFTFQQIAYLFDIYQGKIRPGKLLTYTTFVTFFPQLIAGPIVHHSQMMPQFDKDQSGQFNWQNLSVGITLFALGLFKKVIIADNLAPMAQLVFDNTHQGHPILPIDAWAGTLAYTFQIYFDFSGYSDMAIGAARMFGIILPLNFYSPYKSASIIDFWRHWHITLSSFLRDYLYIPLGGNRSGRFNRYRNLLITMVLGGIWHGAGWGFVIWGTLHGLCLIINHAWRNLLKLCNLQTLQYHWWYRFTGICLTFLFVMICWIFFRAQNASDAWQIILTMSNITHMDLPSQLVKDWPFLAHWSNTVPNALGAYHTHKRILRVWLPVAMFIAFIMPNSEQFMSTKHHSHSPLPQKKQGWLVFNYDWVCILLTVFSLLFAIYNMMTNSISEFLYYDF
ncbi:MBOAT family protein [bacterium AH-315-I18]|nr:MBOAT family protein [Phycisphaeraceae bacterium]MBN4060972.1 MBOAT family protein [bacterium AH-315-I18]